MIVCPGSNWSCDSVISTGFSQIPQQGEQEVQGHILGLHALMQRSYMPLLLRACRPEQSPIYPQGDWKILWSTWHFGEQQMFLPRQSLAHFKFPPWRPNSYHETVYSLSLPGLLCRCFLAQCLAQSKLKKYTQQGA